MRVLILLCVVLFASTMARSSQGQTLGKPNIVLVVCDDLGFGDIQSFSLGRGKIATPHVDRLTKEGKKFTDAHSPSALCTPTRYGLLTGRYAWRTRLQQGVLGGEAKPLIAREQPTIASILKGQGYATACMGKWHLGLEFGEDRYGSPIVDGPLQHGFDHFIGISASLDMPPFAWIEDDRFPEKPTVTKTWVRSGPAAPNFEAVDVLSTLTKRASDYIRQQGKAGKPFFLYLALASPHTPILPTARWKGKSGLGDYGDFVMETDSAVGEVLRAVDEAGQRENTIFIFTADNGFAPAAGPNELEAMGHYPSGPYRGYKADIWEGGHRVPMVVHWPGVVTAGSTSKQLVGLIDLFATVADVVGVKVPAGAAGDSFSFLPLLKGRDQPVKPFDIHHSGDGFFSVREGDWKLAVCAGSGGWGQPREEQAARRGLPKVQLYDLATDPGERTNLAEQRADVVRRLTQYLESSIRHGRATPGPALPNDVIIEINKKANPASRQAASRPGVMPPGR